MTLTFDLPCKPYVKHYLEHCFGAPAYLRSDSMIGKYFFKLLENPDNRFDLNAESKHNTALCVFEIKEDVFLRKGYMLSPTNARDFNRFVEDHLKTQINQLLDLIGNFKGDQIKYAIDIVYDKFDMDETVLPYETIKQSYYRYRKRLEANRSQRI